MGVAFFLISNELTFNDARSQQGHSVSWTSLVTTSDTWFQMDSHPGDLLIKVLTYYAHYSLFIEKNNTD